MELCGGRNAAAALRFRNARLVQALGVKLQNSFLTGVALDQPTLAPFGTVRAALVKRSSKAARV